MLKCKSAIYVLGVYTFGLILLFCRLMTVEWFYEDGVLCRDGADVLAGAAADTVVIIDNGDFKSAVAAFADMDHFNCAGRTYFTARSAGCLVGFYNAILADKLGFADFHHFLLFEIEGKYRVARTEVGTQSAFVFADTSVEIHKRDAESLCSVWHKGCRL